MTYVHFACRRLDGSLPFESKTWNEYKNGFNNGLTSNLWLGNDKIHVLSTKDAIVEMRIDIWGDRNPVLPNPNLYLFAKYTSFSVSTVLFNKNRILNERNDLIQIENEANYYTLHISSPSAGNASTLASNSFPYNNGMKFSTIDVSHDNLSAGNCSGRYELGFVFQS